MLCVILCTVLELSHSTRLKCSLEAIVKRNALDDRTVSLHPIEVFSGSYSELDY